jgi:hypothetical protein
MITLDSKKCGNLIQVNRRERKMKRNLIITLSLLVIFTLTGCLKSSETKTNIISDNESNIEILKTLSPSRDEIRTDILSRLGKNNKAPKLTGELGNYYFVLSDKNISISSNSGTTEVQFIYIENYQSTSTEEVEITTEGKIRYFYEIVDNQWNLIDFDLVIENLPKGTVTGNIKFFDNNVPGLKVFGKNGEEYTKVVKTDSNGIFTINNILFNDYDFHIFGESFEDTVINTITVDTEEVIELGVINILPKETVDFAALTGYIFFDLYKERPVKNANVWLEQNNIPVYDISVSNEAGYYFINNITEGTYILNASIENNIETKEVNIYINNYGSAKVEDLVLLNQNPAIISTTPSETSLRLARGNSINFIVEASDMDMDNLSYDWSTTAGTISVSLNTCELQKDFDGPCEIKCIVSDLKGGKTEITWDLEIGWIKEVEGLPFGKRGGPIVEFNNKLWMLGGYGYGNYYNDIYSTIDGINWIYETTAPWCGRSGHAVTIHNDKIYISGGEIAYHQSINDVWHTEDMINWVQDTDEAQFAVRKNHQMISFQNELWIISGYATLSTTIRYSEIWKSADGVNWTLESDNILFGSRDRTTLIEKDNSFYIIGGSDAYYRSDLWKSTNVITWYKEKDTINPEFIVRNNHSLIQINNKYYIGCGVNDSRYFNDLWVSEDLYNWEKISDITITGQDSTTQLITINGMIFMIGNNQIWSCKVD